MPRPVRAALLSALLCVAAWSTASAHKVIASAWSEGEMIEGEVGFSNGQMADAGTVVKVLGPDGAELGQATVGDDGLFRFKPTVAVAHTFRADMGLGHVAQVTLSPEELPVSLAREGAGNPEQAARSSGARNDQAAAPSIAPDTLDALISEAVRREMRPLRRDLAAYKEERDLQGLLGGLGYIAGIFGLLFFVAGQRRRKAGR